LGISALCAYCVLEAIAYTHEHHDLLRAPESHQNINHYGHHLLGRHPHLPITHDTVYTRSSVRLEIVSSTSSNTRNLHCVGTACKGAPPKKATAVAINKAPHLSGCFSRQYRHSSLESPVISWHIQGSSGTAQQSPLPCSSFHRLHFHPTNPGDQDPRRPRGRRTYPT
jgi:hypothetical protein